MNRALSLKQVMTYIRSRLRNGGVAPTIGEISQTCGLSFGYVHELLGVLGEQRLITRTPNISRGIALGPPEAAPAAFEIDGFEPEEDEDDNDEDQFDLSEEPSAAKRFTDPATARALNAYLKDHRERMASFMRLQREYMPECRSMRKVV